MENFSTPGSIAALTDVELVSYVSLRRLPHLSELWSRRDSMYAKLAIRQMGEFVDKNPLDVELIDPAVDLVIPFERNLITRCYQVFLGRVPTDDELALWEAGEQVSFARLTLALLLSPEANGLNSGEGGSDANAYVKSLQRYANGLNHALFGRYILKRRGKESPSAENLRRLRGKTELKIGLLLFQLDEQEVSEISLTLRRSLRLDRIEITILTARGILFDGILRSIDILLTNNNYLYEDTAALLDQFRESEVVVACWLWDNHHQFLLTSMLVEALDFVFPAHSNGQTYIHSGTAFVGSVIPCCVFQWSMHEAATYFEDQAPIERSDELYGTFNSYPGRTALRDSFINELGQNFSTAVWTSSPSSNKWSSSSKRDRFRELAKHKTVFINSIFNDVPARVFDALLAGSIPLVPIGLPDFESIFPRKLQEELGITRFLPDSVDSVRRAHGLALEKFSRLGSSGVTQRHHLVMGKHFVSHRIVRMVEELLLAARVA